VAADREYPEYEENACSSSELDSKIVFLDFDALLSRRLDLRGLGGEVDVDPDLDLGGDNRRKLSML